MNWSSVFGIYCFVTGFGCGMVTIALAQLVSRKSAAKKTSKRKRPSNWRSAAFRKGKARF